MRIAINGFGRIGRQAGRIIIQSHPEIELVAINDLTDPSTLAHLFKYDSVYGKWEGTVETSEDNLVINGKSIRVFAEKDPSNLPWKGLGVDVVIESTGFFTDKAGASKHLSAGAKKVLISTNSKDADISVVLGVNQEQYDPSKHQIIAGCSCTTNCAAPVAKVLLDNFGIVRAHLSTVHAYTSSQNLVDGPSKDLRRARAAALSVVPTSTGGAEVVIKVLPELSGKFDGIAIRVPIPTVSIVDLVAEVEKNVSADEVNRAFKKAAETDMRGVLAVSDVPLVSVDYIGNPHSAVVDLPFTRVVGGNLVKVLAWYDNEWGYSCRLVELAELIGKAL